MCHLMGFFTKNTEGVKTIRVIRVIRGCLLILFLNAF